MTLKKYKKLLMSCGVERNLAEEQRRRVANVRRYLGLDCSLLMERYEETAALAKESWNGSIRVRRKKIREAIKNLTVV